MPTAGLSFIFACAGGPAEVMSRNVERLTALWPAANVYLMQPEDWDGPSPATDRITVTRLPMGRADSRLAEGIGLQLAFNEGTSVAVVLRPDLDLNVASIDLITGDIRRGEYDIVLGHEEKESGVKLALSSNVAYVAGLWAQLPLSSGVPAYQDLAWVLTKMGDLPWIVSNDGKRPYTARQRSFNDRQALDFFRATGIRLRYMPEPPPKKVSRVAVITPYYKEETWKLRRCHESVLRQRGDVTHFMVADGFPNAEVDQWGVRHIRLAAAHADNGDTPRGIGALVAFAQRFDAVAFLDADNWFADNHLSSLLRVQRRQRANVVCSYRQVVLADGTPVARVDPEDARKSHVDTSCYLFTSERRFLATFWSRMPKFCGPICDRVVFALAAGHGTIAHTEKQTAFFESNYSLHYRMARRRAPEQLNDIPPALWQRMVRPDRATREEFWRCTGTPWPFGAGRKSGLPLGFTITGG